MTIPQPTPSVSDLGDKTPEQLLRDSDFEELQRGGGKYEQGRDRAGNVYSTFRLQILRLTDELAKVEKRLRVLEGNPNAKPNWANDLAATVRIQGAAIAKVETILAAACEGPVDEPDPASGATSPVDWSALDAKLTSHAALIEQLREALDHAGNAAAGVMIDVIESLAVSVGQLVVGLIYELNKQRPLADCLAEVESQLEAFDR